VSDML